MTRNGVALELPATSHQQYLRSMNVRSNSNGARSQRLSVKAYAPGSCKRLVRRSGTGAFGSDYSPNNHLMRSHEEA